MQFILIAALLSAAASPAVAPVTASFRVGPTALKATVPAGYCIPEGKDAKVAELLASGDARNLTHLAAISCDPAKAWKDYFLLKTPNELLTVATTTAELQAAVGPALKAAPSAASNEEASKNVSRVLGSEVQIKGEVRSYGQDAHCLYLGAVLDMAAPEKGIAYTLAMSGCMTVVAGKVVTIYRYGPGTTDADVRKLQPSVLAFAKAITPAAQ